MRDYNLRRPAAERRRCMRRELKKLDRRAFRTNEAWWGDRQA